MHKRQTRLAFIAVAALLSGCATLKQAKLLKPTWFGMEQIAPHVYSASDVPADKRRELPMLYAEGKRRVEAFYGSLVTDPTIFGCASKECVASFGGYGDGFAAGNVRPSILLWTKVYGAGEVAHEWSHLELAARVGREGLRTVPMWFHEGLATVVGEIPRHSEAVYQEAVSSGFAIPTLGEMTKQAQWGEVFAKYPNPKGLNIPYATAGHEVRAWLQRVGPQGLNDLMAAIKTGESFDAAYYRIGKEADTNNEKAHEGRP